MKEETKREEARTAAQGFPCKSCGSLLTYSPKGECLTCRYCGGTEPIFAEEIEAPEHLYDPAAGTADAPEWEGALSIICPSCGAEAVSLAKEMTVTCPFCGSHYVTEPQASAAILRPETMVPHKLSREEAEALFSKWAKRRYFAPRAFRRGRHKTEMAGVYLPYFTFDSDLQTAYSGEGGRRRTVTYTVRVNGKTQTRTKTVTDWYPVSGTHEEYMDDMPVCASRGADAAMLEKIGPFSTKVLKVYHPAYLAGFAAERYTLGLSEGFDIARRGMEGAMQRSIERRLGYDTYRMMKYKHSHRKVTFKHLLLPVFIASYRFGSKSYPFMVNGESGRVAGRAPISPLKVALAVLGALALFALLFALIVLLGESGAGTLALPEEGMVCEAISEAAAVYGLPSALPELGSELPIL